MPKRTTVLITLLVFTASLTACRQAPPPSAGTASVVPVATAGPATLSNDLVVTAEFEPYQLVDVMAKVAGYVRNINVDIGDHVHRGEVLATLEVPEMQDDVARAKAGIDAADAVVVTAQGAVQRAQAQADIAALSFKRIQDVATKDKGLVPKEDVDVAQSHQLEAAAQLASAQASLRAAQQSRLEAIDESERAQQMFQYTTIRAPFDGVITKRYANTGAMVQAGTASQSQAMPIVTIAQDNLLRLILPVPVSDVGDVRDGEPVNVNVVSLNRKLQGTVTRYTNTVALSTRTMSTEVDVPNIDGSLIPGMYAEVRLHLADRSNVLSVPLDAVDGIGTSAPQVWLVRDEIAHLVSVKPGLQTADRVQILSGLSSGDQVIVGRHTGLADGEKVSPQLATYEAQN
jgi:RND family efflux transporter MFP subunit